MELMYVTAVVRNLEEVMRFCIDTLGLKPHGSGPYSKVNLTDRPGFKVKVSFLRISDSFPELELVEPIEGPRVKLLEEKGEGTIYLLSFRVDNIEEMYDKIRKKGIVPVDWDDSPLIDKKYLVTASGMKLFYLPRDKTYGIYMEFAELPDKSKQV